MNYFHKGIAPIVIILLMTLGIAGGTAAGYVFREPIKKAVSGLTTTEEIDLAVEKAQTGQSEFELEGIVASIDDANNIVNVKIKSSTNSIKELRLSETPITVATDAKINSASKNDLILTDIPLDSRVHVGGSIINGKLTANKIIIQKEDATEAKGEKFSVGGSVKETGVGEITVDVKTANSKAKDKKGASLVIKTDATTIIEKADIVILLTEIKVGDEIQANGVISNNEYLANKIEVKIKEKAGELELEVESNKNQNQGESIKNQETSTEQNENSDIKTNNGNANNNDKTIINSNSQGNSNSNSKNKIDENDTESIIIENN